MSRPYYLKLRAAELCVDCTGPAEPGRSRCAECRAWRAELQQEQRPSSKRYRCRRCGGLGHNQRRCENANENASRAA